ncbi:hypothetical protein RGL59_004832 [Vibrio parahaemolyticus]|nr:hypothetical protein [Vibrio parahaemolyticus]EJC7056101.1 hypothetical protein [Vibrio parahaemolyticus]EJC7099511.1 hypothetical protein [Vibrio parahaemolyticus]EJC7113261.1 hypothetical protein [Vibrio parahaemolyticus]EJC7132288.1 hypothetical protein [Vibrio parahaemolyticus]
MKYKNRATIDLKLEKELYSALIQLRDINQWDDEVHEAYIARLIQLALLLMDLDRPVYSIRELSETEREWLLEMLIEQDMFIEEILECFEIFNAVANLLKPNEMQTLQFAPCHLEQLWRKGVFY